MSVSVINADCLDYLKGMDDNTVDFIVTSPPYADARKRQYGGLNPDEYVQWFLPISSELKRVLKSDGSFVLNIKEKCINGERSTYVIELILALRQQGWKWIEEYIWHKKNSMCGKWKNRFRDGYERCLHFTKSMDFNMYQDAVKIPASESTQKRVKNLGENDMKRHEESTGSGFGINVSNFVGRDMVYPDNVLHLACETGNKGHPAVYPERLAEWFVKLFSKEGDLVLDPFVGSGTTAVVCKKLNRNCLGIELKKEYVELAEERIRSVSGQTKLWQV